MVVDPISADTQAQRDILNCQELGPILNRDLGPRVTERQVKNF
jgi:hypothetical protein